MEINRQDIDQHLESTIGELRASYESKGVKASGPKWGESLEHFVGGGNGFVRWESQIPRYIQYSEYGRGPNKSTLGGCCKETVSL